MKMNKRFAAITAAALGMSMLFTACGGSTGSTSSTSAAASSASATESAASETAASESAAASASTSGSSQAASDTSSDLNSKSLDDIIAAAKEEGDVESVGMPDNWADWASLWQNLKDNYGITHTDADMSSAEELQMFQTEGGNAQAAVIASNFALGGDLTNLDPAFEFWAQMAKDGRINTLDITQQNFETGEVEVGVVWSFTGVPYSKDITNYEMKATVPTDRSIQSGYASVINKYAPHPNAAALAREVMFSDEGQTYQANAGGIPTRTDVTIDGFDPDQYKNCILMDDTDAYSKACEEVVSRWQEEITPLLVQ